MLDTWSNNGSIHHSYIRGERVWVLRHQPLPRIWVPGKVKETQTGAAQLLVLNVCLT
jgi:hypothetical protein